MNNFKAWFSWGTAAVFVLYLFLLQASTSVMIPELIHDFAIDPAEVGVLSASFFYTYIILQMPAGSLVDRYGARLILSISMLGCALACWLFASSHSMELAVVSRILMGIMCASGVVGALSLAMKWFPPARFALLVGLTEMLGMLGGAIGQNVLAFTVDHIGWRGTMIACAAFGLFLGILTIGWVSNGPEGKEKVSAEKHNVLSEFRAVLRIPQVWIIGIYGGLVFAVISGFASLWSVPYLMELYDIPRNIAACASSMVFWGAAIGGPTAGWLAAHMSCRKVMFIETFFVLLLSLILLLGQVQISLALMFLGLFLLGFFCGTYILMFPVTCNIVPQSLRGTAMGFTNMMCILFGAPLMQPLIGKLLEGQGAQISNFSGFTAQNYQAAFSIIPIGLIIAFISIFFIREKK